MTFFGQHFSGRPDPEQERWLLFAARYPAYRRIETVMAGAGGWRTVSLLLRCGFFVLGLIAAVATCGLFFLMFTRYALLPAGMALYLVAEWLLRERHVFAAGLEEALMAAGLILLALGAIDAADTLNNEPALLWAMALGWLLAGVRLLNPLFTTLAAVTAAFAVNTGLRVGQYDLTTLVHAPRWSSLFCFSLAALSLWLGQRHWLRPAHDRMFDWLVVGMPVAGYLFWVMQSPSWTAWQSDPGQHDAAQPVWPWWSMFGVLLLFASAAISTALRRRTHAPLLATFGCIACLAYELRHLTGLPLHARLMLWGTVLLLTSYVLERGLRTPRAGITSTRLQDHDVVVNVAELAGNSLAASSQRHASADIAQPATQGQGGQFGGGGASGHY